MMASKPTYDMKMEFENRLVAIVDVLGWSMATKTESASILFNALEPLMDRCAIHNEEYRQKLVNDFGDRVNPLMLNVQFGFISDCLILSMPVNIGSRIYSSVSDIMRKFLNSGFLVRGGVTAGSLFHRDQIVFGPALVEAHKIEANDAKFARVLIDISAINETGIGQDDAVMKDHLGNYIVDPFPSIATSPDMKKMLDGFFRLDHLIEITGENIKKFGIQPRIRDKWRFQAKVCALSLGKYGDVTNDWVEKFNDLSVE
jgi:hypothetical protein